MTAPYLPRRRSRDLFLTLRGLRYRVHAWASASPPASGTGAQTFQAGTAGPTDPHGPSQRTPDLEGRGRADPCTRPALVLLHGWMDVGASFQFLVDALADLEGTQRTLYAPDWRGFGLTQTPPGDCYWFADYLGDLDALLDSLSPDAPVDLLGHSMGGNVAMNYAGVRPHRVRRLINLEGFGLPRTPPEQAPRRLAHWLDELKTPQSLRDYASADEVAQRLRQNNPLLTEQKAAWLAPHWAQPGADGRWQLLGDPAHKRSNPVLYRVEEHLAAWQRIEAPLLWVEGDRTEFSRWWGDRYTKAEFHERLSVVPGVARHVLSPCGHMVHHDQPEALAALVHDFLNE
jgi:pimeloyl-ACP methyl ester carboxylesterase